MRTSTGDRQLDEFLRVRSIMFARDTLMSRLARLVLLGVIWVVIVAVLFRP
jgi:hypothetical protein